MNWLKDKWNRYQELRSIEQAAYDEEKAIVDEEKKKQAVLDAIERGKTKARTSKLSKLQEHASKLKESQEKQYTGACTTDNNDIADRLSKAWGLSK